MASIGLRVSERDPSKGITVISDGKVPFTFELRSLIENQDINSTAVKIDLEADLSPMIKMMASNPLQNLVNIMAKKLKEELDN
jgi:hypothetical protein